jgi:hypothetical protein
MTVVKTFFPFLRKKIIDKNRFRVQNFGFFRFFHMILWVFVFLSVNKPFIIIHKIFFLPPHLPLWAMSLLFSRWGFLHSLLTALTRLPPRHRFVHRGVKEDLRKQYPIGIPIVWWGFSSCTSSIGVLECKNVFGKTGTRTLFQIECSTGKDVKKHSFIHKEDEILLLPIREFMVTSCLDSGNGLYIIQLQETEPKYPLLEPVSLPNPTPQIKMNHGNVHQVHKNRSHTYNRWLPQICQVSFDRKQKKVRGFEGWWEGEVE